MMNLQKIGRLLHKAIDGDQVTYEELQQVDWEAQGAADRLANEAWLTVQQWLSDNDIRDREPEYDEQYRNRMKQLLDQIEALVSNDTGSSG